jgi:uncharacterized membrane-anchored protein
MDRKAVFQAAAVVALVVAVGAANAVIPTSANVTYQANASNISGTVFLVVFGLVFLGVLLLFAMVIGKNNHLN